MGMGGRGSKKPLGRKGIYSQRGKQGERNDRKKSPPRFAQPLQNSLGDMMRDTKREVYVYFLKHAVCPVVGVRG